MVKKYPGDLRVIISPRLCYVSILYANFMSNIGLSVLIRSTPGMSEPRYRHALQRLEHLGFEVRSIGWARNTTESKRVSDKKTTLFNTNASYGAGPKNYIAHLRFSLFIFQTLWRLRPSIIYSCDLDTFMPSYIYSFFRPATLIFDQFDPISARIGNKNIGTAVNFFEYAVTRKADLRITANIERVPMKIRSSWIELKNLFPLGFTKGTKEQLESKLQLFYGGVVSCDRGLLECVSVVKAKDSWRMDIYGQGAARDILEEANTPNIFLHNQIPHSELMSYAKNSNLYLAQYNPNNPNNRLTASNKLFEAAQLGIPLLTNKGTYIGDLVEKFQLGWVVTYGDPGEIERALDEYAHMPQSDLAKITSNLSNFFQNELVRQNLNIRLVEHRISGMVKNGDL
jgi:glycosyltransferase involved in cell wall biosynthesis